MPVDPIIVDTTISARPSERRTYGAILVMGFSSTGTATTNTVYQVSTVTEAAALFGSASDVYKGIEAAFVQGAVEVYAVYVTPLNKTDIAVAAGSVQALSEDNIHDISIAAFTIEYTDGVPTDPGANKAMVNLLTGDIYINGAVASDVSIDYVNWDTDGDAEGWVEDSTANIVIISDANVTDDTKIGDFGGLVDLCDAQHLVTALPCGKAAVVADCITAAALFPSRNVVVVAHNSDDEIAGSVAGVIATTLPWDKLMWKAVSITQSTEYRKSEIGTLEAGDVNVLFTRDLIRMSDGLTTSVSSLYKFIDVARTQYYLEEGFKDRLGDLMTGAKIPYEQRGIDTVKTALQNVCETAVASGAIRQPTTIAGVITKGYAVQVPKFVDVSSADIASRTLNDVYVMVQLSGAIQTIVINLNIQI